MACAKGNNTHAIVAALAILVTITAALSITVLLMPRNSLAAYSFFKNGWGSLILTRNTSLDTAMASVIHGLPLCLPMELEHGYWSPNGTAAEAVKWVPFSQCNKLEWMQPEPTLQALKERNVSIIWSGNSITRHIFFRATELLKGGERAVKPEDRVQWHDYNRQIEKDQCPKDVRPAEHFAYNKPGCSADSCCGVCSCMSNVDGVRQYFIWQQEWFDDALQQLWTGLLSDLQDDAGQQIFLVLNAGLISAWKQEEASLPKLLDQFANLTNFLVTLPPNVHVIYKGSSATKSTNIDMYQAAQDGMIQALLNTIPAAHRPIYLDTRRQTEKFIDYVDDNHYTGRSADATIDNLLHLILNWDELYLPGGRGWEYQQKMGTAST